MPYCVCSGLPVPGLSPAIHTLHPLVRAAQCVLGPHRLSKCLQQHVSKKTEEEDAECLIPGVNASSSWHGGIQARLPKTKRGSSSMLCKWWYFFLFKESKNSKCNLCCHLKGPNKQVRELQKVSGLLKLNTNSSH